MFLIALPTRDNGKISDEEFFEEDESLSFWPNPNWMWKFMWQTYMIKMLSLNGSFTRSLYRLVRLVLCRLVSLKNITKCCQSLLVNNFVLFLLWFYMLVSVGWLVPAELAIVYRAYWSTEIVSYLGKVLKTSWGGGAKNRRPSAARWCLPPIIIEVV